MAEYKEKCESTNAGQGEGCEIPNEEYETQFYGYSPSDVYEGIQTLITDHFDYAIGKLEKQMQKIPEEILPEAELSEGIGKLRLITSENITTTLTKVKRHLLQNIFKIPLNLLLPEDSDQAIAVSGEEKVALMNEIEELRIQLKTEKYMKAALEEELKDQKIVLKSQKELLSNAFTPSNQSCLEEEKLTFLAANAIPLTNNVHSLRQTGVGETSDLEKHFQETFESEVFR